MSEPDVTDLMKAELVEETPQACRVCGGPVPADQVGLRDEAGAVCRRCHYRDTLGEASRTVAAKEEALHVAESIDRTKAEKIRRTAGLVSFAVVVVALVAIWGSVMAGPAGGDRPYAFGPAEEDAPDLDASLTGLWKIRAAMDLHLYRHGGTLPVSIEALGDVPLSCPGCGKAFSYDRGENGEYRIACSSPESHQRAAVFISHRYGPPRVTLHAAAGEK